MFISLYEDRSKFDIAAELFSDAAWVAGYVAGFVIGFAIAVHEQFATPTQTVAPIEFAPETTQPSPVVAFTVNELRARCKTSGIRWNRAGQGGKHLTKTEMIAALAVK
jgi:hypothetical protein